MFSKRFVHVSCALLVFFTTSAFIGWFSIKSLFEHALQEIVQESRGGDFEIDLLNYGAFSFLESGIAFSNVRTLGIVRVQREYFRPREFALTIDHVRVRLLEISLRASRVSIEFLGINATGGRLLDADRSANRRLESVSQLALRFELLLQGFPLSWKGQIRDRMQAIEEWAFDDRPIHDLETSGRVTVIVDNQPIAVRIHSVALGSGQIQLEGNVDDLRVIAAKIEPKFTEADLEVAAKNMLRAPRLMSIRNNAELRAIKLDKRDPEIPYDVPRHIFWSYWLTHAFGEDFAREVTAAHEIGDKRSSPANTAIDHHHNELGIEYAKRQLNEAEVEKLIFEDPRVVRVKVGGG